MTLPLARPVRFPEPLEKLPLGELLGRLKGKLKNRPRGGWPRALAGLGGRRSGKPAACTDCLRGTMLYHGDVALCDHCAHMRALNALNNYEENPMNMTVDGLEIEIPQEHSIGEHLDTIAKALVREGIAKDYSDGLHLARDRHPALAEAYDAGQVIIEGPRVEYRPEIGADLLADLKNRFLKLGPAVANATSLREIVAAINEGVFAEAKRLGRDPVQAWREALANDSGLREAANAPNV